MSEAIQQRLRGDNHHLERRHQTWFVSLDVPAALRASVGSKRLFMSLGTHSVALARQRRDVVIGAWRAHLSAVRIGKASGKPPAVSFEDAGSDRLPRHINDALGIRRAIDAAPDDAIRDEITDGADEVRDALLGRPIGQDRDGEPVYEPAHEARAQAFADIVYRNRTPVGVVFEQWQAETSNSYGPKTVVQHRITLARFERWSQSANLPVMVETFTRKQAGRFITEALTGLAPATIQREVSNLSSLWQWAVRKGHAHENPWRGQPIPGKVRPNSAHEDDEDDDKRPFTDDEVSRLLKGEANAVMHDLIRIGALTGMRVSEICDLRVKDSEGGVFTIRKGKTRAARRKVPIHPALKEIIDRRCTGKAPDAFLFLDDELGLEKPGGSRSRAFTKRFGTYRRAQGVDDVVQGMRQSRVTFHSFRHWFITRGLQAGNPESLVAAVVGQKPTGVTAGIYGKEGPTPSQRRVCVESVQLPGSKPKRPEE